MLEEDQQARSGGIWDHVLPIFLLFGLAVAQPILDLVGRNPEFFIGHRSPNSDIWLLAVALTIAIPLVITLPVVVASTISPSAGRGARNVVLLILGTLLGLQLLRRMSSLTVLDVTGGVVIGAGVTFAVDRARSARQLLRWAGVLVPVVLLVQFVAMSPTSELFEEAEPAPSSASASVDEPAHIVFVVFDEFPVATIMGRDGRVDREMFPNFHRLAQTSTWFRNATGVGALTQWALPSILDGHYRQGDLPTVNDHPKNLFTLLSDDYQIFALEPYTDLCPDDVCRELGRSQTTPQRWRSMIADLRLIGLHLALPSALAADLPPIDEGWARFAAAAEPDEFEGVRAEDVRKDFDTFSDTLTRADDPSLFFFHGLLPHIPFRYLPTGQEYPRPAQIPSRPYVQPTGPDEWLSTQIYQRHVVQTQLADALIGRLLDRLEEEEMLDNSIVIVTADHGAAHEVGELARRPTYSTLKEIAAVPLFIKKVGQEKGRISNAPAQVIDIVPTIADLLGVRIWRSADGVSLFAGGGPQPGRESRFLHRGNTITFRSDRLDKRAVVERKFNWLSPDGKNIDIFHLAPEGHWDLIGSHGPSDPAREPGHIEVFEADAYEDVDPDGDPVPALLMGRYIGLPEDDRATIAVEVNGTIQTVTRTYLDDGETRFMALLDTQWLRPGQNEFRLLRVSSDGELRRIRWR
jgi:hypothetical protein